MLKFLAVLVPILVVAAIVGIIVFFYLKIRYKTVPSNKALIITGPRLGDPKKESNIFQDDQGRYMKVIRGGGHLLRRFQTATDISLNAFQLQISTPEVQTKQGVGIKGFAVATIKVADDLQGIVRYAEQFLGRKQPEIEHDITEVLSANLRAILSKMTVEEIISDRESFNEQVRTIAQEELDNMGFKITSLGLTEIKDDNDYLINLGRPRIAEVKKEADIAEATNNRETKIHVAKMSEEVKKEEYEREMSIAEARKSKEIKDAQVLAETEREKARAEASYELEKAERNLEVERERLKIISQQKEEELRLQQLERERLVQLEKEQVKIQRERADVEYYQKIKEVEAKAKEVEEQGRAEAEVIKLKALAEAESIEKRAEALNKHKDVMMMEMLLKMLPDFARAVSEPLGNVESIRILDGGNGKGTGALSNTVTGTMAQLQESLSQMTGLDLNEIVNNLSGKSNFKGELGAIANGLNKGNDNASGDVVSEVKEETKTENEEVKELEVEKPNDKGEGKDTPKGRRGRGNKIKASDLTDLDD